MLSDVGDNKFCILYEKFQLSDTVIYTNHLHKAFCWENKRTGFSVVAIQG